MILKTILEQAQQTNHPVARALYKSGEAKVLAIALKKGAVMKDHQTSLPAKLWVLMGVVVYRQAEQQLVLHQFDETDIPVQVIHSVTCEEDALCLLIQG